MEGVLKYFPLLYILFKLSTHVALLKIVLFNVQIKSLNFFITSMRYIRILLQYVWKLIKIDNRNV